MSLGPPSFLDLSGKLYHILREIPSVRVCFTRPTGPELFPEACIYYQGGHLWAAHLIPAIRNSM